jgi:peptidoglycan-associated lipoprotein
MSNTNTNTNINRAPSVLLIVALVAMALLTGCPDPPTAAIEAAERALLDAASVSECADKEFKEAEAMLAESKRLVEEGEYEQAEVNANAALVLARQAKDKGEANWDECQKAKNAGQIAEKDDSDQPPPDLALQTIYFSYNESSLTDQAKSTLQNNADWMRYNKESGVRVEGHCDERGSTEFNLALGERRAQSVRKYLMQLGVDGGRMSVLSWGEEKPAVSSGGDAAFTKNRRAEFLRK